VANVNDASSYVLDSVIYFVSTIANVWIVNWTDGGHLNGVYFCGCPSIVTSCPEIFALVILSDDLANVNVACLCDGTSDRLICGLCREIGIESGSGYEICL